MLGTATALALGLGGSAASGVAGQALSAGDRQKALAQNQQAIQQWLNINVPDPESQKIALQHFVSTGDFTPELQKAIKMNPSAFENVQTDPRLKESQMRSLSELQNIGLSGGMTLNDQANQQKAITDINSQDRGQREAILQNMGARGMGGSGMELLAQLQNQQSATNRVGQQELDTTAQARQRALDAIMQSGNLAGNIRGQDYNQAADLARARDAINSFNTQNQQSVNNQNVGMNNQANLYNLQNKQNIANQNTNLTNQQEMYNKNLTQQNYENQLRKAAGVSGQYQNMANQYQNQAQQTANTWGGLGSGLSQGFGAYGQYSANMDYLDKKKELGIK